MLKATILTDNIADGDFACEWGFCALIEYGGRKYLLDTGSTDMYADNARIAGVSLDDVDTAVLSHAHYDHSGGYDSFFACNPDAPLYLSGDCGEDCYWKAGLLRRYIGIPKGVLAKYGDRLRYVDSAVTIADGVWLVPHIGGDLGSIGKKAHLYRRSGRRFTPDDFRHELSLVFDTDRGLVIFNSCSHAGLANILNDVSAQFPDKRVYMTVGGLHLSTYGENTVRGIARTIRSLDIGQVITGHCTGDKAFDILREELGDRVQQTRVGMVITV